MYKINNKITRQVKIMTAGNSRTILPKKKKKIKFSKKILKPVLENSFSPCNTKLVINESKN